MSELATPTYLIDNLSRTSLLKDAKLSVLTLVIGQLPEKLNPESFVDSSLDQLFSNKDICSFIASNDEVRGRIYRSMPKLIPIQKLCTSPEILDHMSHMSGFAPHGFICTNINVRIDFPSLSLQNKFNLPFHQDFLYANEFVTPTKSYVLWLSLLDETRKTGGLRFVTDISEINGLIPHESRINKAGGAPHWELVDQYSCPNTLHLNKDEYLLFDMRHPHASGFNLHDYLPRITLQARYSSSEHDGFMSYIHEIRSVQSQPT